MDVTRKSIGILIDELFTTSNKLWHLQDQEMTGNLTDEEKGKLFRKIQTLNVRRNLLINAIDEILDPEVFSTSEKNYK